MKTEQLAKLVDVRVKEMIQWDDHQLLTFIAAVLEFHGNVLGNIEARLGDIEKAVDSIGRDTDALANNS